MTDVVEYVRRHREEFEDYEYLQQFAPDAEGLRLNDEMAFYRMQELLDGEAVWDDIGSERKMREYATTDILAGALNRERFARGLTTGELNDLVNYNAWSVYAWLALRATEGKSEIIPRQEYELLASCWIALRYPEFHKVLLETIGLDGIIDVGVDSRKELGTAVCPLVSWSNFVVPGMGYIGLNELDHIEVEDPAIVDKERTAYTVSTALSYGCRGEDGYVLSTQNRYVNDAKDESVVEFVVEHLEGLDTDAERTFRQFNAAVELLSFLLHYDNRAGLMDSGPYFLKDGKLLLLREILLDRPFLPSRYIAKQHDLPRSLTIALAIDPAAADLQEIRCGVGTVTVPQNYLEGLEAGAVFLREQGEQVEPMPLEELDVLDVDDLPPITSKANSAVQDWYENVSDMSRRERIMNGARVYYMSMLYPTMKAAGVYEYARDELDFRELHPIVAQVYYECFGQMAQEFIPAQMIFGYGWAEIPEETAAESEYVEWHVDARDRGWQSDLCGMNDVPEYWAERMDDDGFLSVPADRMEGVVDRPEARNFLSGL